MAPPAPVLSRQARASASVSQQHQNRQQHQQQPLRRPGAPHARGRESSCTTTAPPQQSRRTAAAAAALAAAALAGAAAPPAALALLPPAVAPPAALAAAPAAAAAAMAWFGGGAASTAQAPPLSAAAGGGGGGGGGGGAPVPRAERPPVGEIVSDEVANPPDLADFLELQGSGRASRMGAAALEAARAKVGFSRAPSGRVTLFATGGEAGGGGGGGGSGGAAGALERFEVRCDMGAPGFLLLRDESGGCWYLPPDPSGELAQIDLSDDGVVAQLFASHVWEDLLEPLDVADGSGGGNGGNGGGGGGGNGGEQPSQVRQLRLSEGEFRAVLSLVRGSSALPSERLELQRERR